MTQIAVMTLCRDRLDYTRMCFDTLRQRAGTSFDWFVVDQASTDGTREWLREQDDLTVVELDENIGICRALNLLMDEAFDPADYDCIVRFDNDCEVVSHNALRETASFALSHDWIAAPTVLGLLNPPPKLPDRLVGSYLVGETMTLGGIFMAMPAHLFTRHGFRYDERFPPWTGDEDVCRWWRERGGHCGYLRDWQVNHYERIVEQRDVLPAYQERKLAEMAA